MKDEERVGIMRWTDGWQRIQSRDIGEKTATGFVGYREVVEDI